MCLILFEDPSSHPSIQNLPLKFEKDPVHFVFIKKGEPGYQMKERLFGGAEAVIYKPKRLKYLKADKIEHLDSIVSDALGGGGSWLPAKALSFNLNEEL